MNKLYASCTLAAAILTTSASFAQNTNPDVLLQQFNNGVATKAPEDSLVTYAVKYAKAVKRQATYDSLKQQIVALYPKGSTAFQNTLTQMYSKAKNGDLTLKEFSQLKADYPNQTYDKRQTMAGAYYSAILEAGFPSFFEKDSVNASTLITQMGANSLNSIAWNFAEAGKHLTTAEKMSKLSLDKTLATLADSAKIPQDKRAERRSELQNTYASNKDTYAYVLSRLGKKKDALKYEEEAVQSVTDNTEMNSRYIALLNDNKQYKKALETGAQLYTQNKGDKTMLDQIRLAYKKVNPSKSDAAYIAALEAQQKDAAKADLAKTLINKPSPSFTLKDANGNTVSLSDYKDKVVVLDFWATWCGPCKMSFPGMQLAINKYKNNPNVVFLFIDTWENTEAKERLDAVNKLMTSKQYTFHVLLDNKINDRDFEVAKAYTPFGITGIPVKFFIGKDGNVKFMLTGYSGSDNKVLEEVSNSVDFLLSES